MVSNDLFSEMTTEELMTIDGGSFWDDLAEGFGEAFGLKNVTASEVVKATGRTFGDLCKLFC